MFETLLHSLFFNLLDPLAEEILLARYAREEREFTEAAAVPPQLVELYIPSGELWRDDESNDNNEVGLCGYVLF